MQLLGLGGAEVSGELGGGLRVLGVRVVGGGLGGGEGLHLLRCTVHGEGRQLGDAHVVAEGFLDVSSGPGAGEEGLDGAGLHLGQAGVVGAVVEVRVGGKVNQILGDVAGVLREHHAGILVSAVLTEEGQTIVEATDVPGIVEREGDHSLGDHSVEALDVILGEGGLVIVHEPGVVGVGNAVHLAVGASHGGDFQIAILLLDLLLGVRAELADALGLHQSAELIGGEHVDVRGGGRIGLDLGGSVALGEHVVLPSDLVLGVLLLEVGLDLAQPGVVAAVLVLLRGPHAQGHIFSAAGLCVAGIVGATTCGEGQQHSCGSSEADSLLPIDLH